MIKTFCDKCGHEIPDAADANRVRPPNIVLDTIDGKIHLGVLVSVGSPLTGNQVSGIHICKYCIIKAINEADDRLKPDTGPR